MLGAFGISDEAQRVYLVLLDDPASDVDVVAGRLGLPQDEVRGMLQSLAELGLVDPDPAGPERWRPIPPDDAFAALERRERERAAQRQRAIEDGRARLTDLVDRFVSARRNMDERGRVEDIADPAVINTRIFHLHESIRVRSRWMHVGAAPPPSAIEISSRSDLPTLDRGIDYRMIVSEASVADGPWQSYLLDLVARGAEVRTHPAPPHRLLIADEETAVIEGVEPGSILVLNDPAMVAPLIELFDLVWQSCATLGAPRAPAPEAVSQARMRQVVALMAQGYKDDAVARRSGLSLRTVRRTTAAAMAALNADSRFQAGVNAMRWGWLDHDLRPILPDGAASMVQPDDEADGPGALSDPGTVGPAHRVASVG